MKHNFKICQKIRIKSDAVEYVIQHNKRGKDPTFNVIEERKKKQGCVAIVRMVYRTYISTENHFAWPFEAIEPYDEQREEMIDIEESL